MGTIITIASGKGGVGKTLVTAALGLVLSRRGKRILLVDGDMGLRDLDLVLGVQDDVLYDVTDVIRGRCSAGRAILSIGPGLDFLAASQKHTWEKIESSSFQYVLEQLAQEYDGVLVDSPPGRGRAYKSASAVADRILFVLEPSWTSLRDTERVLQYCRKHRITRYALLYNNFYRGGANHISFEEMQARAGREEIAGVLPHDSVAAYAAQEGTLPALPEDTPLLQALQAVADYLCQGRAPDMQALAEKLPCAGAEETDLARPSASTSSGLSLRRRRQESAAWRRPHR